MAPPTLAELIAPQQLTPPPAPVAPPQPIPQVPPGTTAQVQQPVQGAAFASNFMKLREFLRRPETRTALLQFGISALQPVAPGQTGLGQIARSLGDAGQAVARSRASDEATRVQKEQERLQQSRIDVAREGISATREATSSRSQIAKEKNVVAASLARNAREFKVEQQRRDQGNQLKLIQERLALKGDQARSKAEVDIYKALIAQAGNFDAANAGARLPNQPQVEPTPMEAILERAAPLIAKLRGEEPQQPQQVLDDGQTFTPELEQALAFQAINGTPEEQAQVQQLLNSPDIPETIKERIRQLSRDQNNSANVPSDTILPSPEVSPPQNIDIGGEPLSPPELSTPGPALFGEPPVSSSKNSLMNRIAKLQKRLTFARKRKAIVGNTDVLRSRRKARTEVIADLEQQIEALQRQLEISSGR